MKKITSDTVRADFNDMTTVVHYARAAHFLGLWKSETLLIERFFPDKNARLLEAGCGAGRVTIGLWDLGYRSIDAFDFAEELLDQARSLASERAASAIRFFHADATRLRTSPGFLSLPPSYSALLPPPQPGPLPETPPAPSNPLRHVIRDKAPDAQSPTADRRQPTTPSITYDGALFMFNGLMQIPGRQNRRNALLELAAVCASGAPFLFTSHDRNASRTEQALWRLETMRWELGEQNPRLVEFGDRYFEHETGRTFMHLPDRAEILEDLAATGWRHEYDEMRRRVSKESQAVQDFSDECRFWLARKP
ncbi:MAG: class I SAM-dependent methyltransferase [Opitutaceae bacterium]